MNWEPNMGINSIYFGYTYETEVGFTSNEIQTSISVSENIKSSQTTTKHGNKLQALLHALELG